MDPIRELLFADTLQGIKIYKKNHRSVGVKFMFINLNSMIYYPQKPLLSSQAAAPHMDYEFIRAK